MAEFCEVKAGGTCGKECGLKRGMTDYKWLYRYMFVCVSTSLPVFMFHETEKDLCLRRKKKLQEL